MRLTLFFGFLSFVLCNGFLGPYYLKGNRKFGASEKRSLTIDPVPLLSSRRVPQILKFVEPITKTTIVLIGYMHFNPASIELTKNTIQQYAKSKELQCIVVESCPIRWEKSEALYSTPIQTSVAPQYQTRDENYSNQRSVAITKAFQATLSTSQELLQHLYYNEMIAAGELAREYHIPLILGDQLMNITQVRMYETFSQTLHELTHPLTGGWQTLFQDLQASWQLTFPQGKQQQDDYYLGVQDVLQWSLLQHFPRSLMQYFLAFLFSSPVTLFLITGYNFLLAMLTLWQQWQQTQARQMMPNDQKTSSHSSSIASEWLCSLSTLLFQALLISRTFLIALLQERNICLAKSILEQCQEIQSQQQNSNKKSSVWSEIMWYSGLRSRQDQHDEGVGGSEDDRDKEKVVIAVVGMAHCNGIKKLLLQEPTSRTLTNTTTNAIHVT